MILVRHTSNVCVFFLISAPPPTPASPTKDEEGTDELAPPEKLDDRTVVSAPDLAASLKKAQVQDRIGHSEIKVGKTAMADVAMGQRETHIPAEGDEVGRETPVATEAVTKALDQAAKSSKDSVGEVLTETDEKEKEPPGNLF